MSEVFTTGEANKLRRKFDKKKKKMSIEKISINNILSGSVIIMQSFYIGSWISSVIYSQSYISMLLTRKGRTNHTIASYHSLDLNAQCFLHQSLSVKE